MPSGAKKRKAAKKKKGKEKNTNLSTNNPQGNDGLKSPDDKWSDGGECVSPASHDHDDDHHHHHHPFSEGNEEMEEGDPSASQAQPSVFDAKSVEQVHGDVNTEEESVGRKEDPVVVIEWDVKSEESGEGKGVNVETTVTEPSNSTEEAVTFDELVKSSDSSHAKIMSMTEEDAQVGKTGNSVVESSVDSGKKGNALLEKSVASSVGATDLVKNEDKVYPFSDDTVRTSSLDEPEPKDFNNRLPPVSRSPFAESTNGAGHVKDSDAPECSQNQSPVASAPHVVRKTSWLSCCGLFEVLSGSSR